jgi:hypothetical protein
LLNDKGMCRSQLVQRKIFPPTFFLFKIL